MLYSSGGRPATALSPMFGITLPSNSQTSMPSRCTLFGAASFHLSGRWSSKSVGRLDDVVVDAHQDQILGPHGFPRRSQSPDVRVRLGRDLVLRGDGVRGDVHLRDVLGRLDVAGDGVELRVELGRRSSRTARRSAARPRSRSGDRSRSAASVATSTAILRFGDGPRTVRAAACARSRTLTRCAATRRAATLPARRAGPPGEERRDRRA